MKFKIRAVLSLTLVCISFAVFAVHNTPAAVISAFNNKFPGAKEIKWDQENSHEYEAEFTWKGVKHSANFNDEGQWLETESPLSFENLPVQIKDSFHKKYGEAKVKAVSIIETSGGVKKYEIEVKKTMKSQEYFFKEDGTEINQ